MSSAQGSHAGALPAPALAVTAAGGMATKSPTWSWPLRASVVSSGHLGSEIFEVRTALL